MDAVIGGACGGGSSVTNLANDFLSTEKLVQDQGSWAREFSMSGSGMGLSHSGHGPPLPVAQLQRSGLEQSLEEEFMRESALAHSMGPESQQEMMMHTPEMEQQIDFSLQMMFNAIQEGRPFQLPPLSAPLTPLQQERMHHRLSVMSRHFAPDPVAADHIVQTALASLKIQGTGVPPPSMSRSWINEYQEQAPPPQAPAFDQEFERAFRGMEIGGMQRQGPPALGQSWANEFEQTHHQQQSFDAEWERISKQHNIPLTSGGMVSTAPSTVDRWVNEFQEEEGKGKEKEDAATAMNSRLSEEERLLREEESAWFGQFVPNSKKSEKTQGWIKEFNEENNV